MKVKKTNDWNWIVSRMEAELEDKYGEEVVSSLLDVVVEAVNHPAKDQLLNQVQR